MSTTHLTYKYRLYPTEAQAQLLDFLLWQARKVYNGALAERIEAYQERGESITWQTQTKTWGAKRKDYPDTLGMLPFDSVSYTVRRLDKAYKAFFRRVKSGAEAPGFPRFKGRYFWRSVEFKYGSGSKFVPQNVNTKRAVLRLMNVGDVRVRYHRELPAESKIKTVVVSRNARGHWYASLQLEVAAVQFSAPSDLWVGIDVGLMRLLTLSDGTEIDNPRWLRNSLRALRVKQRTVARRKKGSNRQAKAKHEVAVLHDQVANQRRDFWHRVTDWLTKNYAVIVIEDLTLDFMQQNKRLALSAADAGLGLFWQLLEDKAVRRGNRVIRVPAAYTSQECSGCGVLVPKKLSERTHTCVECGCVLDRDLNAAKVILKRGIEAAVQAAQGIT